MVILNVFFDQFWSRYLPAVVALLTPRGPSFSDRASDVFPLFAKCEYSDIGPSGSTQLHDILCFLTMNVINEKVFAFVYIWYVVLLFVSGINLIWRSAVLLSSTLRLKMLQSMTKCTGTMSRKELKTILRNDNIGDWFVLYLLGQNLSHFAFIDVLNDLSDRQNPDRIDNNNANV